MSALLKVLKGLLKVLQFAARVVFAAFLVMAVVGAFVALFGGLSGMQSVKTTGATMSGFGALGFLAGLFVLTTSGLGELLFCPTSGSQQGTSPGAKAMGPPNVVARSNKGSTE